MTARGLLLAMLVAACAPQLQGAPCENDSNCPGDQRCIRNPGAAFAQCVYGEQNALTDFDDAGPIIDAGVDAGFDAGPICPSSPLAGTLTLNGGVLVPQSNDAWVDVWDHSPAVKSLGDGGAILEAPLLQIGPLSGGSFSISALDAGQTYWVSAQYDIGGNFTASDYVDDIVSPPTPLFVGFPPACNYAFDISTVRRCEVVSIYLPSFNPNAPAFIYNLVANVPNIIDGGELISGLTGAEVKPPDSGPMTTNETLTSQPDPTYLSPGDAVGMNASSTGPEAVWAFVGGLPLLGGNAPPAVMGTYDFLFTGAGYERLSTPSCQVSINPQTSAPNTAGNVTPNWDAGFMITWNSADDDAGVIPNAQAVYYDQVIVGTADTNATITWVSPFLPQAREGQSYPIPPGACPAGKGCFYGVLSARAVQTDPGTQPAAVSIEESMYVSITQI